jgi:hypothetical protein
MMTADRSSPFRIAPENTMLPPAAQSPPNNIPMRLKIGSFLSCILSIITPFFATATCRHYARVLNNSRVGSPFFGILAYYRHASALSSLIIRPSSGFGANRPMHLSNTRSSGVDGVSTEKRACVYLRIWSFFSKKRGTGFADGSFRSKSSMVCSWPVGCCSRHSSSSRRGHAVRTALVRCTLA